MSVKRIVSFLPSATELLYEFGVQDNLYGEHMNANIRQMQIQNHR